MRTRLFKRDNVPTEVKGSRGYGVRFYVDAEGEWRWQAFGNGRVLADSGQGYKSKGAALKGAHATLRAFGEAFPPPV